MCPPFLRGKGMGLTPLRVRLFFLALLVVLLWALKNRVKTLGRIVSSSSRVTRKGLPRYLRGNKPRIAEKKFDLFLKRVQKLGIISDAEEIRRLFPRHFELLGHVVVVKLNPGVSRDAFSRCASAFAECFSPRVVSAVLIDAEGIGGELRKPHLEVFWSMDTSSITMPKESLRYAMKQIGESSCISPDDIRLFEKCTDSPTFTTHVENGVRYSFDVCKVMFCSGNGTERMYFSRLSVVGEVIVDMFAGIGYFTIPLAMHGSPKVIHTIEKNPTSVDFLKYNAVQNKVSHLIHIHSGDNREVGSELCGQCDRVIMGYIPSCMEFLPRAFSFLRRSSSGVPTGTLHYHFLSDKKAEQDTLEQHVRSALGENILSTMRVDALRVVKSYAPKRSHCVADIFFGGE